MINIVLVNKKLEVFYMKKLKSNKVQQKASLNKNTKTLLLALAGVAFVLLVVFVILENLSPRIIIKNTSGKKLEYVKAYFVDYEDVFTDTFAFENINSSEKKTLEIDKIDCSYRQANLEVVFKFEGEEEMFVDAGYFNDEFKGKISISFDDSTDGKINLKVKASSGVIKSPNIICNEEYIVNLEEGYVEE